MEKIPVTANAGPVTRVIKADDSEESIANEKIADLIDKKPIFQPVTQELNETPAVIVGIVISQGAKDSEPRPQRSELGEGLLEGFVGKIDPIPGDANQVAVELMTGLNYGREMALCGESGSKVKIREVRDGDSFK